MKIRVYIDGADEPIATLEPPEKFRLDTNKLEDGAHVIQFKATDESGKTSIHEVPITVQNGPAIAVHGVRNNEIVHDQITILANAYSSEVGDTFEPMRIETPRPVPTWAWLNFLFVFAWGMWYLGIEYQEHQAAASAKVSQISSKKPAGSDAWSVLGEQIYGNTCAACHGASGDGLPGVFPALKGNAVVLAENPTEHVRIVINGLQGKTIDGVDYSSPMPAFAEQLNDEEIAAVVNHERTSWGNSAPTVTTEQVALIASGSDITSDQAPDDTSTTAIPAVSVSANNEPAAWDWQELGTKIYGNKCASCHQATGVGLPGVFPALAGNTVVGASDPAEHIRIILDGLTGKTIDGVAYASPMPAFASQLSDQEIAAVINHERTNWDNSAPLVTPDLVKQYR